MSSRSPKSDFYAVLRRRHLNETDLALFARIVSSSESTKYTGSISSVTGRSEYLMGYGDVSVELSQVSHRPSEGGRLPTYMDVYDER